MASESHNRLCILLIVSLVLACYFPTLKNGFVWDDNANFVTNHHYRGLSPSHLHWMATTFDSANYFPLTWLSLGGDFAIWGMNPAGYHLTNLVLHMVNAILFFYMVMAFLSRSSLSGEEGNRLFVPISGLAGTLYFALHPLRVETVSWISTRGDLLCAVFIVLTILAYFTMATALSEANRRKWYLVALAFFLLSLLSRAWGMTLPVVLLILDVYPLGRVRLRGRSPTSLHTILVEKIPFVLLAFGAAILAFLGKKDWMMDFGGHSIVDRIAQGAYGLVFYPWKTLLPINLSPFYFLDKGFDPMAPVNVICLSATCAITVGVIVTRRRWPWAVVVWFCYGITVSPLLGLVQSGLQIAADRYTYISCLPFAVLFGSGVLHLFRVWEKRDISSCTGYMGCVLIGAYLLFLTYGSMAQIPIWRDDRSLFTHIIALDSGNYIAYYERGLLRDKRKDFAGAAADYTRTILLDPSHAKAYNNRGVIHRHQGSLGKAMADFSSAISLSPFSPEAYANRGVIHLHQGDCPQAIADLREAIAVAPDHWSPRASVESILADALRNECIRQFSAVSGS